MPHRPPPRRETIQAPGSRWVNRILMFVGIFLMGGLSAWIANSCSGPESDSQRADSRRAFEKSAEDAQRSSFSDNLAGKIPDVLRKIGIRRDLISAQTFPDSSSFIRTWTIRIPAGYPPVRVNSDLTLLIRRLGGSVHDAWEDSSRYRRVHILAGTARSTTDHIVLKPDAKLPNRGKIAIVIDDFGYRPFRLAKRFARLRQIITFAVLPHHPSSARIAMAAREGGHEVIVHIPMEPEVAEGQVDGPTAEMEQNTLMVGFDGSRLRSMTESAIESVPGAVGINNHMGSKATADRYTLTQIMAVLITNNFLFLDSRTSSKTIGAMVARELGIPSAERTSFLDNDRRVEAVTAALLKAGRHAEANGFAVAIGHDRPETLIALQNTLPEMEARGFRFVGISEVAR